METVASLALQAYLQSVALLYLVKDIDTCEDCLYSAGRVECAALNLDMARAALMPPRRMPSWV